MIQLFGAIFPAQISTVIIERADKVPVGIISSESESRLWWRSDFQKSGKGICTVCRVSMPTRLQAKNEHRKQKQSRLSPAHQIAATSRASRSCSHAFYFGRTGGDEWLYLVSGAIIGLLLLPVFLFLACNLCGCMETDTLGNSFPVF